MAIELVIGAKQLQKMGTDSHEPTAHDKSLHAMKVSPRMLGTKPVIRKHVYLCAY